jgi:hypothetical protein
MNHLAMAEIRGISLKHAWTTTLTLYVVESTVVETDSFGHGACAALLQQAVALTSILIAFSYGYGRSDETLPSRPTEPALPAMRLGALTAAAPSTIDLRRLLQGTMAVCIFAGSVYVVSQGSSSSVLIWVVSLTQGLGLIGAFAGKLLFDPLIGSGINWYVVFLVSGVAGTGLVSLIVVNRPPGDGGRLRVGYSMLARVWSHHPVFASRQTWICGIVAGLLLAPLMTGGMTWSLAFFENDLHLGAGRAVTAMGLVAFGWLVGRPLVALLADHPGQRKLVVLVSALVMITVIGQITMWTDLVSPLFGMFVFGVASASTTVPYKLLLEANVSQEEHSGMASFRLLNLFVLALISLVFHQVFGPAGEASMIPSTHLHQIGAFWMSTVLAAMVFAIFLREPIPAIPQRQAA